MSHGYSLAPKEPGTIRAWGSEYQGELDDGRTLYRPMPAQMIPPGSHDRATAMMHEGDFRVGGYGVSTLTLTNVGLTATACAITVTDILPPGLS